MNVSPETYRWVLALMAGTAGVVFVALYFVNAGYGPMFSPRWGPSIPNRWAWMLMEAPVFAGMCGFWAASPRQWEAAPLAFFLLFQAHYLQRSFIFPWLIRGRSRMPLAIMAMAVVFNLLNAFLQGEWIFFLAPEGRYTRAWLSTPQFVGGTLLFVAGFAANLHSDHLIRRLRREEGDSRHHLPRGGLFRYVTSANYFGELLEWLGFAVLTWSAAGLVFFLWTFANLVPRAHAIHRKYRREFPEEMAAMPGIKRVIPFVY